MSSATPKLTTGMFTSRTEEWATPQSVFDTLDAEFHFTLDVCATVNNAKCKAFYDKERNGLAQRWGGVCWMNPPYGKEIGLWMRKAYEESKNGSVVVCLVPARTDTRWWHEWAMKAQEIRLVRGRLKFGDGKQSAPFPSCVVIFRPNNKPTTRIVSSISFHPDVKKST